MSDCKFLKRIKGRVVGHVYLIDGLEMSQCQALEYLQGNGFSAEDSQMYLSSLQSDEQLIAA